MRNWQQRRDPIDISMQMFSLQPLSVLCAAKFASRCKALQLAREAILLAQVSQAVEAAAAYTAETAEIRCIISAQQAAQELIAELRSAELVASADLQARCCTYPEPHTSTQFLAKSIRQRNLDMLAHIA